jgi:hypothetical protein
MTSIISSLKETEYRLHLTPAPDDEALYHHEEPAYQGGRISVNIDN